MMISMCTKTLVSLQRCPSGSMIGLRAADVPFRNIRQEGSTEDAWPKRKVAASHWCLIGKRRLSLLRHCSWRRSVTLHSTPLHPLVSHHRDWPCRDCTGNPVQSSSLRVVSRPRFAQALTYAGPAAPGNGQRGNRTPSAMSCECRSRIALQPFMACY